MKTMVHTDAMHPNAKPVVYAHTITFAPAVGKITSTNWHQAMNELATSRFGAEAMRDVAAWERENSREARRAKFADEKHKEKVEARAKEIIATPSKPRAPRTGTYRPRFVQTEETCDNPACGSTYTRIHYRQRYCTDACYRACKTRGESRPKREASPDRILACAQCGAKFVATGSTSKLCSDACRIKHKKRMDSERGKARKKENKAKAKTDAPQIPCSVCSAMFTPATSRILTCSPPCSKEHRRASNQAYKQAWEQKRQEAAQ